MTARIITSAHVRDWFALLKEIHGIDHAVSLPRKGLALYIDRPRGGAWRIARVDGGFLFETLEGGR